MFHSWIDRNASEEVFVDTAQVIFDVLSETAGVDLKNRPTSPNPVTVFGAHARLIRPGQPNLMTIGNCACLGPELNGYVIDERDWEYGFAEYGLHNIDREEQKISLYAGLGHLAALSLK